MITKKDVQYISSLARIHFEENELVHFTKDLEKILGYIDKLSQLDVTEIKPTSHVFPIQNVYRKDAVKPSLNQSDAIKLTPHTHNGAFKVPQVLE